MKQVYYLDIRVNGKSYLLKRHKRNNIKGYEENDDSMKDCLSCDLFNECHYNDDCKSLCTSFGELEEKDKHSFYFQKSE
jgi:hypothetical protein